MPEIVEYIALTIVLGVQFFFFFQSLDRMGALRGLFPDERLGQKNIRNEENEGGQYQQITSNYKGDEFVMILSETNAYLKNNQGAADFNIIKDISERKSANLEGSISANVALPLYTGLMGTFGGVILGLIGIFRAKSITQDGVVHEFLLGVIVAMSGSLCGLLLTTFNNTFFLKKAIEKRDVNKNKFYDFLQVDLLPHFDNSLHAALNSLRVNINEFNRTFSENIGSFDTIFGKNVTDFKESVGDISKNIGAITENTRTQKEFLLKLQNAGFRNMAETNLKLSEVVKEIIPTLSRFIKEQNDLNDNLEDVNGFAEKIAALLDRISVFEDNINKLGRDLKQSDMMGAEVLTVVKRHLSAIEEKEAEIERYVGVSNDQLKKYLSTATDKIRDIVRDIELGFEKAFDFNFKGNLLGNLEHLKAINENLVFIREESQKLTTNDKVVPLLKEININLEKNNVDSKPSTSADSNGINNMSRTYDSSDVNSRKRFSESSVIDSSLDDNKPKDIIIPGSGDNLKNSHSEPETSHNNISVDEQKPITSPLPPPLSDYRHTESEKPIVKAPAQPIKKKWWQF